MVAGPEGQKRVAMRDRAEPGDVDIVGPLIRLVQPEARFVMDRKTGSTGKAAFGFIVGRDLLDHLLEIQRHHELVGIGIGVPVDAAVRHGLVDEGEFQLFVELVHQYPVVERRTGPLERQRDHVPAAPFEGAGILPGAGQKLERAKVFVACLGDFDVTADSLILLDAFLDDHSLILRNTVKFSAMSS